MKVIPYPDHWLSYKPRPDMQGKCLGVFAHVFVKNGAQVTIRDVYKNIADVAIEEESCIVLSSAQSLVDTKHNMLYEEWTDYDEFFEVQMSRTYRKGFHKWIDPIKTRPVSPEFTEMFYSSGRHPYNIAYNAFSFVQSIHVSSGSENRVRKLFSQYIDDVARDAGNVYANAHQSLNNPQHFLLYEVWLDFSSLVVNDLKSERRLEFAARFSELADPALPEPAMEIFQVYYDPGKYGG